MGRCSVEPIVPEAEKPFKIGTYTGNGAGSRTIGLGFTPSLLLVEMQDGTRTTNGTSISGGLAMPGVPLARVDSATHWPALEIVQGGFVVHYDTGPGLYTNQANKAYLYIAFR